MKCVALRGTYRIRGDHIDVHATRGAKGQPHEVTATFRSSGDGYTYSSGSTFGSGLLTRCARRLVASPPSDDG